MESPRTPKNAVGFSAYLQSTIASYEKQRDRYTLTDLQVEYQEEQGRSPDGSERQSEKQVERLEVLVGLRKYVQKGHVLLVGKPGAGKSTALQRLRWELAQAALGDEQQPIPVLVALRSDRPILDILCAEFRRVGEPIKPEEIDELLRAGRLFLLLDGLNEIPSQEREHQIDQFRQDNSRTPMIFTSRELGTGFGIEQKLEMCGLTERQMRSFVQNYLPDYAEVLLRQLKDRLRELAETPLLLKLLCDVFDPVMQQIPQSKGELFRAVDAKFNTWKQREGVRTAEKFWQWNGEILCYLAFVMLQADGTPTGKWLQIERSYAEHLLEEFLRDRVTASGEKAKDWLQDLLEHHLLQLAANSKQIEFHHQLFQEYYAAEYLLIQLKNISDAQLERAYLNLLKWTEPLAVMLTLVEQETQALRVVRLALDVNLMLGARLAGEVRPVFGEPAVKCIQSLTLPIELMIKMLGITRSTAVVPELLLALKHTDFSVRSSAIVALGKLDNKVALQELFQALEGIDHDIRWQLGHNIGWHTVRRLVELGNEEAIPKLIPKLIYALKNPRVLTDAASALSKLGGELVISELFHALKDQNSNIRIGAALALGKLGIEAGTPELLHALNHSDIWIQQKAAEVLGELGCNEAVPRLLQMLKEVGARESAAKALTQLGNTEVVLRYLHVLESSKSFHVRRNAAETLGFLGSELAIPGLLRALQDSNSSVRKRAIQAIGELGSKSAIPGLLDALKSSHPNLHWRIALVLGELGSEAAIPGLLDALQHTDDYVRMCAVRTLGKFNNEAAISGLLQVLKDPTYGFCLEAALSLACLGSEAAVPELLQALQSKYTSVEAANALGQLGSSKALICLSQLNLKEPRGYFDEAIVNIQNRCQFYNYEIFCSEPEPVSEETDPILNKLKQIEQGVKTVANQSKNDFSGASFTGPVNFGDNPTGNFIGTQHNYAPSQSLTAAAKDIQQLLEHLAQTYPNATEAEVPHIVNTALVKIEHDCPQQWATLRKELLNRERWFQGGKAAVIKATEQLAEKSVIVQSAIAFLEAFSQEKL